MRLTLAALFFLALLPGLAQQPALIHGDYIEDRSNRVFGCYCEWSGERITGGKEAILGWHIREGDFLGTPLAGLRMAAVVMGESTLSAGNALRRSILFLDQSAPKPQQLAGEALLRRNYGSFLGEVVGVQSLPIEFHRDQERAVLRIGELASVELRKADPPVDALQGAVLWYDPFVPMSEPVLGMTVNTRYRGSDLDKQWDIHDSGISGYFGTFSLPLKQPPAPGLPRQVE